MSTPELTAITVDLAKRDWLRSLPAGAQLGLPRLSEGIEPNRDAELEPADPRMRGWRQYDRRRAVAPGRYPAVDAIDDVEDWDDGALSKPQILVWENPATGELRRCEAAPLTPWTDPWAEDSARILAEIRRRICTCGAADISMCVCRHRITGWTYTDSFWTETIKPLPERKRTRPAQYPMHTRWGRFRNWWWNATHRQPEQVGTAYDNFVDNEEWT